MRGVERREITHLEADPERGELRLSGGALDLAPTDAEVSSDAKLIDEFMRGYRKYFSGKVDELIQDYSAFTTWFFAAPFIWRGSPVCPACHRSVELARLAMPAGRLTKTEPAVRTDSLLEGRRFELAVPSD